MTKQTSMTANELKQKVLFVQLLGQLLLEELEDLHGIEPIWRQEGKQFGNLAIIAGDKFVNRIGRKVSGEQTQHYADACKIVRENLKKAVEDIG